MRTSPARDWGIHVFMRARANAGCHTSPTTSAPPGTSTRHAWKTAHSGVRIVVEGVVAPGDVEGGIMEEQTFRFGEKDVGPIAQTQTGVSTYFY